MGRLFLGLTAAGLVGISFFVFLISMDGRSDVSGSEKDLKAFRNRVKESKANGKGRDVRAIRISCDSGAVRPLPEIPSNDVAKVLGENTKEEKLMRDVLDSLSRTLVEGSLSLAPLAPAKRALLDRLTAAMNGTDLKKAMELIRLASKDSDERVRGAALDALIDLGGDEADMILDFLNDESLTVRSSALMAWEQRIAQSAGTLQRMQLTRDAMLVLEDPSSCNYLSMNFVNGGDKANAVEMIIELMGAENAACKDAAKTAYDWVTDTKWTDAEQAKAWLADYLTPK